jgi:TonB family protein
MIVSVPGRALTVLLCLGFATAGGPSLAAQEASPPFLEAGLPAPVGAALDAIAAGEPKAAERLLKEASRSGEPPLPKLVSNLLKAYREHERYLPNQIVASMSASPSLHRAEALAPEIPAADYGAILAKIRSLLQEVEATGPRHHLRALLCNLRMLSGEGNPPKGENPRGVSSDVDAPRPAFTPVAQYTEGAREERVQGVVISQVIIDREGCITRVKILKGLPLGIDDSVRRMHRWWAYEPATFQGEPIAVYYNLTTNFRLQ